MKPYIYVQMDWPHPGSNLGPHACEAHVITTTLHHLPTTDKNTINKSKLLCEKKFLHSPSHKFYFLLGLGSVRTSLKIIFRVKITYYKHWRSY